MDFREYLTGRNLVRTAINNSALTESEQDTAQRWVHKTEDMLTAGQVLNLNDGSVALQVQSAEVNEKSDSRGRKAAYDIEEILKDARVYTIFESYLQKTKNHWYTKAKQLNLSDLYGEGITISIRRYAYQMLNGAIPSNVNVYVACGDQRCVRPEHLRTSLDKDNG